MNIMLWTLIIPAVAAALVFLLPRRAYYREVFAILVAATNLILVFPLFRKEMLFSFPWGGGWGLEFSLRVYPFASFMILSAAAFALLIALYSASFMKGKDNVSQFYAYFLLTIAQVNGVLLSNNLIMMLFFWEGLLLTLFGFIAIGGKESFKTAVKAFVINGVADICFMAGIALTGFIAGTFTMSGINIPAQGLGSVAFLLLMIGAIGKAGAMPFHSWIPDAAKDAPLPFMAFIPGSIEKIVGIYFLARISLDLFKLDHGSWLSYTMMTIGAVTILAAVMMALVQHDFKKLLSYHAISQVGYMILGIGTCVPVGIIGGLFHMINNALYKDGLFLAGGAVERQTGTTDLNKLGGIGLKMPITFACFLVAAFSISGVPPFNGFFSKELIYDGALERGWIFYGAAALGSFLTAASFLKLGHAAFLGKRDEQYNNIKEVPWTMYLPMIVIAAFCIFFGVYNSYPIYHLIQPVLSNMALDGNILGETHANVTLVIVTIVVLTAAYLNHRYGVKKTGKGIGAVDHIHYAPVLHGIYDKAERKVFDPYDIGLKFINAFSYAAFGVDRATDWVYNVFSVKTANVFSNSIKKAHTGNFSMYILWSLAGMILLAVWIIKTVK
ncbi:MAG: proton-conducting transporter membrane subunit [Pseudomonadota bacterium]